MSEIRFNQTSTFGQVPIAGMLATQFLPTISQPLTEASRAKGLATAPYRTNTNTATYSYYDNLITGEHSYAIGKPVHSWMTLELMDFINHSTHVTLTALDHLMEAIRDTYGNVQIDTVIHTDPEEGWIKPVITVRSEIEDFDKLLDIEDAFFIKAASDTILLAILPFVVISLA